jgi:hypothetical protein
MDEERKRILRMIEEGRLSAEEGARLLDALDAGGEKNVHGPTAGSTTEGGKTLHIRVFDGISGREKVNMNVPIGLAKMVSAFIPESQRANIEQHGIRIEEVLRAVENGEIGKVVDIQDHNTGEEIEISIE